MDNRNGSNGTNDNALICWGIAALAGVFTFVMLLLVADWSVLQAIFGGVVVCAILGILLSLTAGRDLPRLSEVKPAPTSRDVDVTGKVSPGPAPAASSTASAATSSEPSSTPPSNMPAAKPEAAKAPPAAASPAAAVVPPAAAAGSGGSGGGGAAATAPAMTGTPAGEGAASAEDRAKAEQEQAAANPASPTPPASSGAAGAVAGGAGMSATAAAAAEGPGRKPEGLSAPRDGSADDLKKIKGIGPKLEKLCNSLGFWHFDQIASWGPEEVAWVDQNLEGFKGRVTRDEWVSQARSLAAGEETAFSKKVDKGGVY